MITVNTDGKIMVRRCLVTFKPFRIFVVGIGFFSLCFLMTSLGGQFSAKRLGDSPFTIRTEGSGSELAVRYSGGGRKGRAVTGGISLARCRHKEEVSGPETQQGCTVL
ncbi:hypothetical protein GJAV_G00145530 [Gymnothorax javanicus]|nr:hypothetical protein GJAV_G00145530 [Gymnothorax javanicus]